MGWGGGRASTYTEKLKVVLQYLQNSKISDDEQQELGAPHEAKKVRHIIKSERRVLFAAARPAHPRTSLEHGVRSHCCRRERQLSRNGVNGGDKSEWPNRSMDGKIDWITERDVHCLSPPRCTWQMAERMIVPGVIKNAASTL